MPQGKERAVKKHLGLRECFVVDSQSTDVGLRKARDFICSRYASRDGFLKGSLDIGTVAVPIAGMSRVGALDWGHEARLYECSYSAHGYHIS